MKKSFSDILSEMDEGRSRKLASKLPAWADAGCTAASRLALEQCSSQAAALHKADIVASSGQCGALADITGGMGVDSWAFSRVCGKVLYNERDASLFSAAEHNCGLLGIGNVEFSCHNAESEEFSAQLRKFKPDWIYADPARRAADGSGRKVYMLEDCTPNILTLMPTLLGNASHVMLKLSPMADIKLVTSCLPGIKEVQVVGVGGEVKEILCIIERGRSGTWPLKAVSLNPDGTEASVTEFTLGEEMAAATKTAPVPEKWQILFEPSAVLLKAGCFKLLCERYGMLKLDRSTHLYILPDDIREPLPDGRRYRITEVRALSKATIKEIGAKYPDSDVSARNIPITSEELKARLHAKGGGEHHIFGLTAAGKSYLVVTEPLLI